jgi:hypothetical protein
LVILVDSKSKWTCSSGHVFFFWGRTFRGELSGENTSPQRPAFSSEEPVFCSGGLLFYTNPPGTIDPAVKTILANIFADSKPYTKRLSSIYQWLMGTCLIFKNKRSKISWQDPLWDKL